VDDAQLHAVVDLDLEQRLLERLDGTGDVALDDEVERLDLALFESTGEVLERDALAGLGQLGVALGGLALLGDLAGHAVLLGDDEDVAGARDRVQTLHLDGTRRVGLVDRVAVLVDHGADAAVGRPATIASPTRSVPDWMSTVATEPRPLSSFASIATPRAALFGLAVRSSRRRPSAGRRPGAPGCSCPDAPRRRRT
jgi:hypothetical protein